MNGTLRDDLIAAKALIDTPEKWGAGSSWGSDRRCAQQALMERCRGGYDIVAQALPLWWKVRQLFRGKWSILSTVNVIRFNDDPSTTHPDIMALFDRAIAAAEAGK